MDSDHTRNLFESAPILYSGRYESISKNLMSFGFECGDGWYYPLLNLSENLEGLNILFKKYGVRIKAFQVKEKFSTLRFYYDIVTVLPIWKRLVNIFLSLVYKIFHEKNSICTWGFYSSDSQIAISRMASNFADILIEKCEHECENYCEECGTQFGNWNKDEKVVTRGWIRILCRKCAEKNNQLYVPYGQDPFGENNSEEEDANGKLE